MKVKAKFLLSLILVVLLGLSISDSVSANSGIGLGGEPFAAYPQHVDLRDVAKFQGRQFPELTTIHNFLAASMFAVFPEDVYYGEYGATKRKQTNIVFGVELEQTPIAKDGMVEFPLVAFFHEGDSAACCYRFRRFIVRVEAASGMPDTRGVQLVGADIPLQDTRFAVELSLLERKIVVHDSRYGLTKVYPAGVGGFSMDLTQLKTPEMEGMHFAPTEWGTQYSRTDPYYYQGYPFIRILDSAGRYFAYGFHVSMNLNDPSQPGLFRGFVSTGCVRLTIKDTYELWAIARWSRRNTPVAIRRTIDWDIDHPFPMFEEGYARVLDGSRDPDENITNMILVDEEPPLQNLRW